MLLDAGTRLVTRAAEKVLTDPRGQEALARAVGMAQRGRRRVEELQQRLMQAAGIPARQDYQELAKQLARIKRKARDPPRRWRRRRDRPRGRRRAGTGVRTSSAARRKRRIPLIPLTDPGPGDMLRRLAAGRSAQRSSKGV
jgi:hypothetical protein